MNDLPSKGTPLKVGLKKSPLGGVTRSKTVAQKIKDRTGNQYVARKSIGDKNKKGAKTRLNRTTGLSMKTGKTFKTPPTTGTAA